MTKLNLTNPNVITNVDGQVQGFVGEKAIDAFRLRTIISGLTFEAKTRMRFTRGVSCKKLARQVTGLKTNNIEKLTERLNLMLQQRVSECAIITDGKME